MHPWNSSIAVNAYQEAAAMDSDLRNPVHSDCACASTIPSFPPAQDADAALPSVSLSYLCNERVPHFVASSAAPEVESGFPRFSSASTVTQATPCPGSRHIAAALVSNFGAHIAWYRVYSAQPLFELRDDSQARAVFEALVDGGVEADTNYLVVQAAQQGHTAVVELALELSTGTSAGMACGWWAESLNRAIAEAVAIGSVEIAQLLFEYGARIRSTALLGGPDGTDAVYRAASKGHDAMVDWLITVARIYGPPSI